MRSSPFLLSALTAFLGASTTFGSTIVPGGNVSGTWSSTGSPFLIQGDITVPAGANLTIEPGVDIEFEGFYQLIVEGALAAVGADQDSIRFTASDPLEWQGIRIQIDADPSQLAYCVIERGAAVNGGGIHSFTPDVSISHCTIRDNRATSSGGGICIQVSVAPAGPTTISDCIVSGNVAGYDGGGIHYIGPQPILQRCRITDNEAGRSGGGSCIVAWITGEGADISECIYTGNRADTDGGGAHIWGQSSFGGTSVSDCEFSENYIGAGDGGGICLRNTGIATITNCTFYSNINASGVNDGTAIFVETGTSTISHCTFDHSFTRGFGTVRCGGAQTRIESCTFTQTLSHSVGSALYLTTDATIVDTIFSGNTLGYTWPMIYLGAGTYSVENCDLFGQDAAGFSGPGIPAGLGNLVAVNAQGDSCDAHSNIFVNPLLCESSWGAPGDLRIASNSPCLGTGTGGGDIGALGIGCAVSSVEPISWGRLKARYR